MLGDGVFESGLDANGLGLPNVAPSRSEGTATRSVRIVRPSLEIAMLRMRHFVDAAAKRETIKVRHGTGMRSALRAF
jgi:hypothetical protein